MVSSLVTEALGFVVAGAAAVFFGGVVAFVFAAPEGAGLPFVASAARAFPANRIVLTRAMIEIDPYRIVLGQLRFNISFRTFSFAFGNKGRDDGFMERWRRA
jgi:hypothetical protein